MYKKDTYVLGTNLSHDGSACLLKNGRIVVAIEKERLTRIKHDGGNDTLAIEYCLKAEGITINDVDLVVQNANFEKESISLTSYYGQRPFPQEYNVPVVTISHHLAHAYSAIGTMPFETSNVVILDGSGSPYTQCDDLSNAHIPNLDQIKTEAHKFWCEKLSLYHYNGSTLTPLYKDFSEFRHLQPQKNLHMPTIIHSIGGVYQVASVYCFGNVDDTGKLMGLSPYGKPINSTAVFELKEGRFFNTFNWMDNLVTPYTDYQDFKKNFNHYADVAHHIQNETEKAVLYIFNHLQQQYPCNNWSYAGGVALNAVANQKVLAHTKIDNLYIQPAAGDNGIAIGCAYYGWLEVLKKERILHNGKTNFGIKYNPELTLKNNPTNIKVNKTENWITEAAKLLAEGNIIGWFVEGSEFGPRALGYRSILADPRKEGVRDYINREIKKREDFRPFAPAVLKENSTTYFQYDWDTPYMIMVNPVKPEWKDPLKSVVHLNDTARVQTVTQQNNPNFYHLLKEFKKLTGLPILLNTSFNRRGMPIVETPQQAIDFFSESPLDYLIFENLIISKQNEFGTASI